MNRKNYKEIKYGFRKYYKNKIYVTYIKAIDLASGSLSLSATEIFVKERT